MKGIFLILLIGLIIIVGCEKGMTLDDVLSKNNYLIVDVRTKEEYDELHIKDALNIPYDEIGSSNLDKTKTILVYCKSGVRSKKAYDTLKKMGYEVMDLGSLESIKLEKE